MLINRRLFFLAIVFCSQLQGQEGKSTRFQESKFVSQDSTTLEIEENVTVLKRSSNKNRTIAPRHSGKREYTGRLLVQLRGESRASFLQNELKNHSLDKVSNASLSEKNKIESLLKKHQFRIENEQQNFVREAIRNNLISKVVRRHTGLMNVLTIEGEQTDIEQIKALASVKRVERESIVYPLLDNSVEVIRAPQVWQLKDIEENNIEGEGVRVAIIDSGISYSHSALGGCLGEECKVIDGYNFVDESNQPIDDSSHGTHVAGIVASIDSTYRGVAPQAKLLAYKVCDLGSCAEGDIIAALERSADPNEDGDFSDAVDVANISLGSSFGTPHDLLAQSANAAVGRGVVVVVAAGNDGQIGTMGSLAAAEDVITVAATNFDDNQVTEFSSRGGLLDTSIFKPEISAPGEHVMSSFVLNGEDDFRSKSGTSMAAPHVAGVVALLRQLDSNATPKEIKSKLVNSAKRLTNFTVMEQGGGRVDALASAESRLVFIPSILNMGNYEYADNTWISTKTLSIVNSSNVQQTPTIELQASSHPGVNLELDSEPHIVLEPGASTLISVTVIVNKESFEPGSLFANSIESELAITSGTTNYRIPVVFSKLSLVGLQFSDEIVEIALQEKSGKYIRRQLTQQEIIVPSGIYHLLARFDDALASYNIVRENVDLNDNNVLYLAKNEALNEIQFASVIDLENKTLNFDDLDSAYFFEFRNILSKNIYRFHEYHHWKKNKRLFISSFSDAFDFRISGIIAHQVDHGNEAHFYVDYKKYAGLNETQNHRVKAEPNFSMEYTVDDQDIVNDGYGFTVTTWGSSTQNRSFQTGFGLSARLNSKKIYFRESATLVINGMPKAENSIFDLGTMDFYTVLEETDIYLYSYITSRFHFLGNLMEPKITYLTSGWDAGADKNVGITLQTASVQPKKINELGVIPLIQMIKRGLYFSSGLPLNAINDPLFTSVATIRDSSYGRVSSIPLRHDFYCDDSLINSEVLEFLKLRTRIDSSCQEYRFSLEFTTRLRGAEYTGTVSHTIMESYVANTPYVQNIAVRENDGIVTNPSIEGALLEIHAFGDGEISMDVAIKYDGGWETLELSQEGQFFYAELPMPDKSYLTALKLFSKDVDGDALEMMLPAMFILGKDDSDFYTRDFDEDGVFDYEDEDDDNDGTDDLEDDFPYDPTRSKDNDNDGIDDSVDDDDDNDGVLDINDAFPLDATESVDTDLDGIGNNADTDDDNDGVLDTDDAFPLDANESVDTDNDGIGNNADTDDDNDGVLDADDAFPIDPAESIDTDNDGTGNNADTDDDNDQMPDAWELQYGLNPLDASDASGDLNANGISNLNEYLSNSDPTHIEPVVTTSPDSTASSSGGGGSVSFLWMLLCCGLMKENRRRAK